MTPAIAETIDTTGRQSFNYDAKDSVTPTIYTTKRVSFDCDTMEEVPSTRGLPEPIFAKDSIGWYGAPIGEHREESNEYPVEVGPLVRMHHIETPRRRFRLLQQWECVVNEVAEDSVWADITDLTDRSRADEVVELPLDEFPLADRELLVPGGVFYWAIGYEHTKGGQVRRVSEIRFRRTPKWSKQTVEQLKTKARTMLKQFVGTIQRDASPT
jgi:hypothetical protein